VMTVVESVRERNRLYPYSLTSVPADSPELAAADGSDDDRRAAEHHH